MIFAFLTGLNTSKDDWETVRGIHNDYKWPVKLGYWCRGNILRKDK